jgi:hypothetical protein
MRSGRGPESTSSPKSLGTVMRASRTTRIWVPFYRTSRKLEIFRSHGSQIPREMGFTEYGFGKLGMTAPRR